MTRQPRLLAKSRTSSPDIFRRTRSSAGCVTTYSDRFESASPIFAARAGKSLCIFFGSNDYLRDPRLALFSLTVVAAVAWVCDSIWARGHEQPCGRAKVHVRLVSPYRSLRVEQAFVSTAYLSDSASGTSTTPTAWFTGAVLFLG